MWQSVRPVSSAVLAVAFVLAAAGCARGSGGTIELHRVDCPAAPGSQAPNLSTGLDGKLYLSWIEASSDGHALRFSTWDAGAWSAARTIAEGDDWFVNWADFPSMAALEDGTLIAHWLVMSGEGTYAYDVNLALSRDGGASWSEPLRPHRDATPTEHGFVSLVPTVQGTFDILWLDGRNTAGATRGAMTLRHATLHPDGELTRESEVDASVCDCCSTDALRTGDGATLVVYRDRTAREVRDVSIARLEQATWSAPRTVHADNWEIAACPVNGPAVSGRDDLVVVAWFTASNAEAAVQVAFSRDGGRSFGAPVRVDHGDPLGRVDVVLLDGDSALVSWLERTADGAQIRVRRARPSGAVASTRVATTSEERSSGFPRMARLGDDILLAWTEPGEPSRIATARLSW